MEIDKSCPHGGLQFVESVKQKNIVARWLNKCDVMQLTSYGKSLPKEVTLALQWQNNNAMPLWWTSQQLIHTFQSYLVLLETRPSMNYLAWTKRFGFDALRWPINKTHQVVCDSLIDYGRLEWQQTLAYLKTMFEAAYQNVPNKFDSV